MEDQKVLAVEVMTVLSWLLNMRDKPIYYFGEERLRLRKGENNMFTYAENVYNQLKEIYDGNKNQETKGKEN